MKVTWSFTDNKLKFRMEPETKNEKAFLTMIEDFNSFDVQMNRPSSIYGYRDEAENAVIIVEKKQPEEVKP